MISFAKNMRRKEVKMSFSAIKKKARALFNEASFITHINNKNDYKNALALIDELIEDYDNNRPLIEMISNNIEHWENRSKEFSDFNNRIKSLNSSSAVLKVLIEQHQLKLDELPEIGSKSLVSKILNNKRRLTLNHIRALSNRFNISPNLFF